MLKSDDDKSTWRLLIDANSVVWNRLVKDRNAAAEVGEWVLEPVITMDKNEMYKYKKKKICI